MTVSRYREFTIICPDCYQKIGTTPGGIGKVHCDDCGLTLTYNIGHVYRRKQKPPAKILLKRKAKSWLEKEE